MAELLCVQLQEVARRCCRTEHAHGRGDVPALGVMFGTDRGAQQGFDFDTHHQRGDQLRAAGAAFLGECQRGWKDRGGRVAAHRHVGVIEVERVTGGAVDQRGNRCGASKVGSNQGAGSLISSRKFLAKNPCERFIHSREDAGEPIADAMAGHGFDVPG